MDRWPCAGSKKAIRTRLATQGTQSAYLPWPRPQQNDNVGHTISGPWTARGSASLTRRCSQETATIPRLDQLCPTLIETFSLAGMFSLSISDPTDRKTITRACPACAGSKPDSDSEKVAGNSDSRPNGRMSHRTSSDKPDRA